MPKGYAWVFTGRPKKPLTGASKKAIEERCRQVIETLRQRCIGPSHPEFGYTVDIYGKWYRHYYHFIQKIRYDKPGFENEAEFKFTRLECFADNTCNLAYMRHTGQWVEVFQGLSLEQCLEEILNNSIFYPS